MASVVAILRTDNLQVSPGRDTATVVTVHNVSGIVEQFRLSVIGEAAPWATLEPESLSLLPNTQADVTVTFHAPREWFVEPGEIPFGVMVEPSNDAEGRVVEEGVLVLEAIRDISAELLPAVASGRRSGKLGLAIDSRSNIPIQAILRGRDPSDTLVVNIKPRNVILQPGTTTFARIKIVPRHRYLRGPQKRTAFQDRR